MSRVRMHFCTLVARGYGAGTTPTAPRCGPDRRRRSASGVGSQRSAQEFLESVPAMRDAGRRPDGEGDGLGLGALGQIVDRVLRVRDSRTQLRLTGLVAADDRVAELPGLAVDVVEELPSGVRLRDLVGDDEADGDS